MALLRSLGGALRTCIQRGITVSPRLSFPSLLALPAMRVVSVPWAVSSRSVHSGAFRTISSIKKRLRVKANGSIVRGQANRRHLNMAKSRKHVNRLGKINVITTPGIRKKYLRILKASPLKGR